MHAPRIRFALLALVGCGPPAGVELAPDPTGAATGTATAVPTDRGDSDPSGTSSTVPGRSTASGDDGSNTAGFIDDQDGGGGGFECDVWAQDCPVGEKCSPAAVDGGSSWTGTRCTPVAANPRQVGESCTAVESAFSGIDDCDRGTMCVHVVDDDDDDTLAGQCMAHCSGSEANPVCGDPCTRCAGLANSLPALCLLVCDPLAQNCGPGLGCYGFVAGFGCQVPDVDAGVPGDPCEHSSACEPGSTCIDGAHVPGCEGFACCAAYCDVDAPNACDAQRGTECVPWFDDGGQSALLCQGPGTIGVCRTP